MRRCTRLRVPRWGTLVADNENAFDIQCMRPCDNARDRKKSNMGNVFATISLYRKEETC